VIFFFFILNTVLISFCEYFRTSTNSKTENKIKYDAQQANNLTKKINITRN